MLPTSYSVRSFPPVIFHTIPVALSIPISSNGDWMAFNAASLALVLPAHDARRPQRNRHIEGDKILDQFTKLKFNHCRELSGMSLTSKSHRRASN